MVTYSVMCDEDKLVDYLGVFEAGEERELLPEEVESWNRFRGVPLLQDNLPEGVHLTVVVTSDEEKEEAE